MARVELSKLAKVYPGSGGRDGVRAVSGVDLSIRDGEFVVLVGPSGCGKSTLLRMIAGLEEVTEGTLTIDGRVVNHEPARDRDIAFVFQNYALYPHLTVWRNLAFGLERRRAFRNPFRMLASSSYRAARQRERAALQARVEDVAATLGLTEYLQRFPRELSGGQRQRVAVGRAIVRDPKVFLFDEPLSNLDAKLRVEMRGELRVMHRRLQSTMIYVTHDQEEAMGLGDRLVVLKDGVVQQIAPPAEVYAHPANRFVASFVGTPTMNFVEGRLHRSDTERVAAEAFAMDLPPGKAARAMPGPIVLGVRPDRIMVGRDAAASPWRGDAAVEAVELLGDRADLLLRCGPHRLVARVAAHQLPSEGERVPIGVDPAACHLFETGDAGVRTG